MSRCWWRLGPSRVAERQPGLLSQANFWEPQACSPAGWLHKVEEEGVKFSADGVDFVGCQLSDTQRKEFPRSAKLAPSKAKVYPASLASPSLAGSEFSGGGGSGRVIRPLHVNVLLPAVSRPSSKQSAPHRPPPHPPPLPWFANEPLHPSMFVRLILGEIFCQ